LDTIWSVLSVLLPFLFVLTVVVFIHELFHFLVARWCGVKVQAFSIGFGREICGFHDRHGTRWRLAWIPLGGYVKFIDDENGASVPSRDTLARMSAEEKQGAFQSKSIGQRSAVVAAGPIANFLLAIVIFAGIYSIVGAPFTSPRIDEVVAGGPAERAGFKPGDLVVAVDGRPTGSLQDLQRIVATSAEHALTFEVERGGLRVTLMATPDRRDQPDGYGGTVRIGDLGIRRVLPPKILEVIPDQPAARAGFLPGDVIVAINGNKISNFQEMQQIVSTSPGQALRFEVDRDGQRVTLTAVPDGRDKVGEAGSSVRIGVIGVRGGGAESEYRRLPVHEAIWRGVQETHFIIARTLGYLKNVVVGRESPDQVGGVLRIADVSGQVAASGFIPLLNLTAILSVSIGLLNLFPIPLLDGGHLMFYLMEAIRRKPLTERTQEIGFRIGLSLVLMLMIYATFNDRGVVMKWIGL
jgi:regulator of sigma E protease